MDRRNFMKTTAAGAVALALPSVAGASSPLDAATIETKARELVGQMTLDEKIAQMSGSGTLASMIGGAMAPVQTGTTNTPANERLGIPGIRFTDGPRGVNLNRSTCFPVSMARGASWDPDLEERIGEAIGYEARAQGANFTGAVCINALRHPGWGRAQETFGEDPYQLGRFGESMVRGIQNHIMACAKHYACNSIEQSRFFVNVKIDERTLREIYLPHFKRCVDAGAAAIMSAYNEVNGPICSESVHLLREILKGEWGFDGLVMSDFVLGTESTVDAANGGLDIEMPITIYYGKRLKRAALAGKVAESVVDEAALRIVRQKLRFLHLEDAAGYDRAKVAGPEHVALALESARKGIVLLKNEGGLLPLQRESVKKLAVIGELAEIANMGDIVSSKVTPPYGISPFEGLRNKAGSVEIVHEPGKSLNAVKQAAAGADVVIVVVGLTSKDEGEYAFYTGGDREDLGLHRRDVKMIRAAAAANPRCVVVMEGGSAITVREWIDEVPAVIMAWYPGMEGGNALAEIVFGDVNPSAKLPTVFPQSLGQLPFFSNKVKEIEYGYYHGYRLFDKKGMEPEFAFGHGLSYTTYAYSNLRLSDRTVGQDGKVAASVDVTNTGARAGDEVVQLYVGYEGSAVDRPVKDLKGFARVSLEPGQTKTVAMEIEVKDLAYYDVKSGQWKVEDIECQVLVGPSSREADLLAATFRVKS